MAVEIKMPQLSDTMHSGKILGWMKKEGEQVARGDVLAEVETDKANLQIESFQQGVLLKIVTPANQTANVGDVIAYIGQAGENVVASGAVASTTSPSSPRAHSNGAPPAPAPKVEAAPSPVAAPPPSSSSDRIKASPLARKIAEQKNIDLSIIQGSGPLGRIVKKDIEAQGSPVSARQPEAATPTPRTATGSVATSAPVIGSGASTPLSKMRETIARRMQESVTTAPHFYVTACVNMREASKLRGILKERPEFKGISINHLVIKAVAYALEREPRVNYAMRDGQLYQPAQINIGIVTALEDGLLIPVVKEANTLPLKDLVFEARAAVERARAGRPSASDLTGGTFSISNMGMFDVENFTAIINPGQGGILAVSSIKEEPVVENGQVVAGLRMRATVSVDHRIIDGVMAGTFLKHFTEALETPALLLL